MRAVIIGAVESTQVALEAMGRASGWEPALVLTLHPELASRHSDFVDLAPVAERAGAVFRTVRNINDPDAIGYLREAKPDYLFIIGWSQICGADVMGCAPGRVVGYHPAALPRQRGRAAIPWTILNREPITAGSLFWIDDGVDTGAILDQQYFHVAPTETAASLYAKHMAALATMFDRSLAALAAGTERRDVQDEALATWCAKRTADDGLIDWEQSARDIDRLVRAVGHPYPGAFTSCRQDRLFIWSAHVMPGDRHAGTVGQVVSRDDSGFAVMCGDGHLLQVTEWSSETMRPPALHQRIGTP